MKQVTIDRQNRDAPKPQEGGELFITVFTDASHCPDTNAYGIGVWVRAGADPIVTYSKRGIGLKDSTQAEYFGITDALKYIKEHCETKNKVLVLQCDNISALGKLDVFRVKLSLKLKHVKLKHVKGHTNGKTRRTRVNSIVDGLAYNAMSSARSIAKGCGATPVNYLEAELQEHSW